MLQSEPSHSSRETISGVGVEAEIDAVWAGSDAWVARGGVEHGPRGRSGHEDPRHQPFARGDEPLPGEDSPRADHKSRDDPEDEEPEQRQPRTAEHASLRSRWSAHRERGR